MSVLHRNNLRTCALSHIGKVRQNNQDSAYAGQFLFLVADGMGGHKGGDIASATVAHHMAAKLDREYVDLPQALDELNQVILEGNNKLTGMSKNIPTLSGMGTTISSILLVEDKVAIAHVGDSRIYLFREGILTQITKDHTFVQKLIDSGKITEKEAQHHFQRSVILRALGDVGSDPEIDNMVYNSKPDDVWLLCSDGLSGVLSHSTIEKELRRPKDLEDIASTLVNMTLREGAPDNVSLVLLQISELPAPTPKPHMVGSARTLARAENLDTDKINLVQDAPGSEVLLPGWLNPETIGTADLLSPKLGKQKRTAAERFIKRYELETEAFLNEVLGSARRHRRHRIAFAAVWVLISLALIATILGVSASWISSQYYLGIDLESRQILVYQGINEQVGPITLSNPVERIEIEVEKLDRRRLQALIKTIPFSSLEEARKTALNIKEDLDRKAAEQ